MEHNRQTGDEIRVWNPITFDLLLSQYSLTNKRVLGLLVLWMLVISGSLIATLELLPQAWISLSSGQTDILHFFIFNPAVIVGTILFFWFGFEWGFIPIFLCSFIIAFHSHMPPGWALLFGISFVLGLGICAMAYQGFNIPYDLRSLKSIVFYISIMFIASIASSLGAFIWSFTLKLSAYQTLIIWKSWWSGLLLQAVLFAGPILWLFTPPIERLKHRWFDLPAKTDVSLKWIYGAVISITGALALFIFSGKLLGKLRVEEVMTQQHTATVLDVLGALQSYQIISWISIGIIIVTGYGAFNLIHDWNKSLSDEVKKRTRQLDESQKKLKTSLEEKEVLLKEIHHRVKNNLALVSALLELQEQSSDHDIALDNLQTARSRIRSMAMAHEALYQNETLSNISMKEYLKRIGSLTQRSFTNKQLNVNMHYELEDTNLDMDKSIPLGLLINEILINAYKHAFTGRDSGDIWLKSTVAEDEINISVQDNGVGMADAKSQSHNKSLGMTLIRKFSKQLGGELDIESDKQTGTTFSLAFTL